MANPAQIDPAISYACGPKVCLGLPEIKNRLTPHPTKMTVLTVLYDRSISLNPVCSRGRSCCSSQLSTDRYVSCVRYQARTSHPTSYPARPNLQRSGQAVTGIRVEVNKPTITSEQIFDNICPKYACGVVTSHTSQGCAVKWSGKIDRNYD